MSFCRDYDQDYFHWLCELIQADQMDKSWILLANKLHDIEFYSIVEHDENRMYDGLELREEYLRFTNYPKYLTLDGPCSMLEMLIALARRMEFETSNPYVDEEMDDNVAAWFWELMDNLGLREMDDSSYWELGGDDQVENVMNRVLERDYDKNGIGGLFPLKQARNDQRDSELWYQMGNYLSEKECV